MPAALKIPPHMTVAEFLGWEPDDRSGRLWQLRDGESEMMVFWRTQRLTFAPLYWTMVVCNFVLPLILLGMTPVPHRCRTRRRPRGTLGGQLPGP
jgi:hypothetical protein